MSDPSHTYRIEMNGVDVTAEVLERLSGGFTMIDLTTPAPPSLTVFEDVVSLHLLSSLPLPTAEIP